MIIYILLLNFIILPIYSNDLSEECQVPDNSHTHIHTHTHTHTYTYIDSNMNINKTLHDNEVIFCLTPVIGRTFPPPDGKLEYSISDGQPYDGYTVDTYVHDGEYCQGQYSKIIVKAGRHGSDKVSQSFMSRTKGGAIMAADKYRDKTTKPNKLNFWIRLFNFKVGKVVIPEIYLGQGDAGTLGNNWWVGSKYLKESTTLSSKPLYYKNKEGTIHIFNSLGKYGEDYKKIFYIVSGNI